MNNNTTPMGSTTKLVVEKSSRSSECCCCEGGCCGCGCGGIPPLLVALTLSFSLANIIRLPRMAYLHGAGGFLIVYLVLMVVVGVPLVFLEILLGQLCQQGATKLSRAVPLLRGVGYVKLICSVLVGAYYPVIMSVSLFYSLWTIKGPLPFSECSATHVTTSQPTTTMTTVATTVPAVKDNNILPMTVVTVEKMYAANGETCLIDTFLKPPAIDPMWFGVNVTLLFLLWAFIMLCVCRGAASYRVSALCLFLALVGCLGALLANQFLVAGPQPSTLSTLFTVSWHHFLSFDTWYFAAIQVFFSAHIGFGNIVTCSGNIYSKSNAFWTSVLYMVTNAIVGVGAVCLVYLWLENRSFYHSNNNISPVAAVSPNIYHYSATNNSASTGGGREELFVLTLIYDVAVSTIQNYSGQATDVLVQAKWWAVVAYLFLILSGFTSVVCIVYSVSAILVVETKNRLRWWLVTATLSSILFIAGIALMLPERFSAVHILDDCVVGRAVAMTTALELVGFMWIYGVRTLASDFEFVLGHSLSAVWIIIWFIAPIFLVVIEVWSLFGVVMSGGESSDMWLQRDWVELSGWLLYAALWLIIIILAIYQITQQVDYNLAQKFLSSVKPSRKWGPVDPIYRHGWVQWKNQYQATGERDFTLKRRGTRDYTHSIARSTTDMNPSPHYSGGSTGRRHQESPTSAGLIVVPPSSIRRQHHSSHHHNNNSIMMTPINHREIHTEQPEQTKLGTNKKSKRTQQPPAQLDPHTSIISAWESSPSPSSNNS